MADANSAAPAGAGLLRRLLTATLAAAALAAQVDSNVSESDIGQDAAVLQLVRDDGMTACCASVSSMMASGWRTAI
ncbi:hypothetical protein GCM10027277_50080 [Pseudoduganella ginsengisoli]|uniref:Uncharacterized protein n=1 Tax=Pseudoduganella ginsengisoli TaxID=1462440 RepID=A0A6L6Q533_9BURK|nr:hypothetical protein [Pseudoduganella ginsengisoli]MTW04626.1 hypothetical protein [Pseudoduganella ginsengisoli]